MEKCFQYMVTLIVHPMRTFLQYIQGHLFMYEQHILWAALLGWHIVALHSLKRFCELFIVKVQQNDSFYHY